MNTHKIIILLLLALVSCKTHQPHTSHTSHDTLIITRTLPIHDTLYIPIAPPHTGNNQCDTLCQQQLQQLLARLQQLNTYKSHNQQIHTSLYKMQPVPYVPTWIKILAGIGILVVIYICYRISRFFTLKP